MSEAHMFFFGTVTDIGFDVLPHTINVLYQKIVINLHNLKFETRGPWALALCLTTNLTMGQSPKSSDIHSLSIPGKSHVEIEHIFALWAAVSEIMADFQNCHIWA